MIRKIWPCLIAAGLAGPLTQAAELSASDHHPLDSRNHVREAQPLQESRSWNDLRGDVVGDAGIADGSRLLDVIVPYRASDPATMPVTLKQLDTGLALIEAVILVIDENPAPVVAEIRFGDSMAPLDFTLRVRVNAYSNVRALAQTADGIYMHGKFVKATGGCAAPPGIVDIASLDTAGRIRSRHFGKPVGNRREAQIMIQHPNFSGLQRDQLTQLNIPAHFINFLEVYQGDDMLFSLEGGISVSENPVFRFEYSDNGTETLRVRATDTEGAVFEAELPKNLQS